MTGNLIGPCLAAGMDSWVGAKKVIGIIVQAKSWEVHEIE
jgi:hypothetical protein